MDFIFHMFHFYQIEKIRLMNNKVNFFIIGAPKCGTTALAEYLSEHNDIFMSDPKEIHYFANDFENYRNVKTLAEYELLFNSVDNEKAIGEGSVFYFYSEEAMERIKLYNEDAKLILMLRNPVEMVPSLHAQLIVSGDEDILDFEEAWFASEKRKNGHNIFRYTREIKILFYDEIAKYSQQLMNVRKHFDEQKIKVILFDDFKRDPKRIYEEVLDFLDVVQNNKSEFPVINENEKPISFILNMFLNHFPLSLIKLYREIKKIFGLQGNYGSLIVKLRHLNLKKQRRKAISVKMKKAIIFNYKEDILNLSRLLKKDLSHWLE